MNHPGGPLLGMDEGSRSQSDGEPPVLDLHKDAASEYWVVASNPIALREASPRSMSDNTNYRRFASQSYRPAAVTAHELACSGLVLRYLEQWIMPVRQGIPSAGNDSIAKLVSASP